MRKKPTKYSSADQQLLEALNQRPELKERILAIVRLAASREGTPARADEIEALLVAAVQQLGRETMKQWAQGQAAEVAREVRRQHPHSHRSKKKR